jgi:hypothetical protein
LDVIQMTNSLPGWIWAYDSRAIWTIRVIDYRTRFITGLGISEHSHKESAFYFMNCIGVPFFATKVRFEAQWLDFRGVASVCRGRMNSGHERDGTCSKSDLSLADQLGQSRVWSQSPFHTRGPAPWALDP